MRRRRIVFSFVHAFLVICARRFLVVTVVSVGNHGRNHPMSFSVLIVHTTTENLNCFFARLIFMVNCSSGAGRGTSRRGLYAPLG